VEIDLDHLTPAETGDLVAVPVAAVDRSHVLHPDPAGGRLAHDRASDLVEVLELVHGADEIDSVEIAKGAAGLVDVLLAQGLPEVRQRQTEGGEPVLVSLDHDLGVEPAAHLGCGNPDHRLETRLEPPLGKLAQFVEIPVAGEAKPHDRFERRVETQDARYLGLPRELDQPEALADVEARGVHRLAPLELEHDL